MVQAAIPKTVTIPAGWVRIGSLTELMLLLLLVVLVLLALYGMNPPNRVSVNAPLSEFSSVRAMQHLKVISASSHPIGSADQNLDERSLQHHGSYVFALTRYFGNHDLNVRSGRDAVYFDLFGLGLAYSGFGAGQPRPDNIFYGQNADSSIRFMIERERLAKTVWRYASRARRSDGTG